MPGRGRVVDICEPGLSIVALSDYSVAHERGEA